jgi:hypothetical protein
MRNTTTKLNNLGLVEMAAEETRNVNGGVHMSAQNYALLQDLLAVHQSIRAVRSARATLRAQQGT